MARSHLRVRRPQGNELHNCALSIPIPLWRGPCEGSNGHTGTGSTCIIVYTANFDDYYNYYYYDDDDDYYYY